MLRTSYKTKHGAAKRSTTTTTLPFYLRYDCGDDNRCNCKTRIDVVQQQQQQQPRVCNQPRAIKYYLLQQKRIWIYLFSLFVTLILITPSLLRKVIIVSAFTIPITIKRSLMHLVRTTTTTTAQISQRDVKSKNDWSILYLSPYEEYMLSRQTEQSQQEQPCSSSFSSSLSSSASCPTTLQHASTEQQPAASTAMSPIQISTNTNTNNMDFRYNHNGYHNDYDGNTHTYNNNNNIQNSNMLQEVRYNFVPNANPINNMEHNNFGNNHNNECTWKDSSSSPSLSPQTWNVVDRTYNFIPVKNDNNNRHNNNNNSNIDDVTSTSTNNIHNNHYNTMDKTEIDRPNTIQHDQQSILSSAHATSTNEPSTSINMISPLPEATISTAATTTMPISSASFSNTNLYNTNDSKYNSVSTTKHDYNAGHPIFPSSSAMLTTPTTISSLQQQSQTTFTTDSKNSDNANIYHYNHNEPSTSQAASTTAISTMPLATTSMTIFPNDEDADKTRTTSSDPFRFDDSVTSLSEPIRDVNIFNCLYDGNQVNHVNGYNNIASTADFASTVTTETSSQISLDRTVTEHASSSTWDNQHTSRTDGLNMQDHMNQGNGVPSTSDITSTDTIKNASPLPLERTPTNPISTLSTSIYDENYSDAMNEWESNSKNHVNGYNVETTITGATSNENIHVPQQPIEKIAAKPVSTTEQHDSNRAKEWRNIHLNHNQVHMQQQHLVESKYTRDEIRMSFPAQSMQHEVIGYPNNNFDSTIRNGSSCAKSIQEDNMSQQQSIVENITVGGLETAIKSTERTTSWSIPNVSFHNKRFGQSIDSIQSPSYRKINEETSTMGHVTDEEHTAAEITSSSDTNPSMRISEKNPSTTLSQSEMLSNPTTVGSDVVKSQQPIPKSNINTCGMTERIMNRIGDKNREQPSFFDSDCWFSTYEALKKAEENWNKVKQRTISRSPIVSNQSHDKSLFSGVPAIPFVTSDAVLGNPKCWTKLREQASHSSLNNQIVLDYDIAYCGDVFATILALATVIRSPQRKICVIDSVSEKGTHDQEWFISSTEIKELVRLGILSDCDVNTVVVKEFPTSLFGIQVGLWFGY
jgi:hypothetical protein